MIIFTVFLLGAHMTAEAEEVFVITAVENTSVSLNCTAVRKDGVDYRAVRWYKEGVDPRLTGLVSRTPPGGSQRWYVGADTNISVEYPSLSLLLPPVSCSDSGVYQCYMAAPVGEQNREGRVRLSVMGCPTDPPMITELDERLIICRIYPANNASLHILVAVAVLIITLVVIVLFLSCRRLKNAFWRNTKTPGKEPYPDPNSPPEKQDLLWINILGPSPKKSGITAA